MSEVPRSLCPQCGAGLSREDAERGFCAACRLGAGLETGTGATETAPTPTPERHDHPASIGRYRILRVIGEGGMGIVYEAEQDKPRRLVALKVIRAGRATTSLLRRFEQESQLLGLLQHPGIAQIYEAGTADTGQGPQPYFAMEFVRGLTLDRYAETRSLGVRERLELVARICDGVEHAHQKGIVHRDLKPGNILVDESGQPKILDFGVARATDSDIQATMHTDVGAIVGTLPYMSPEQVAADPTQLDTRSDVYALGVVLYEILSGHRPYDLSGKQLPEAVRIIREDDPAPLSSVSRVFRGDVETIATKALSKERERRYQSAAELAADIRRHLANEPIVARPASAAYHLGKFARRNKALVGGVVAVFVVLVAGVVASSWQAVRARQEAAKARAVSTFLQDMLAAVDPWKVKGREVTVRDALDEAARKIDDGALADQPEIDAAIRVTLGNTYGGLGLYSQAEPHVRAALGTIRKLFGPEHPDVGISLRALGLNRHAQGDYAGAAQLFRESAAILRNGQGDESPELAHSLHTLAEALRAQGDMAGAEPLFREALAIRRKALGDEHPDVATTMNNLALLLQDRGDLDGAEPLFRESLALRRDALGDKHPDVAGSLNNLGILLKTRGDPTGAEALFRESLAIYREAMGDEHPLVATNLNNLAATLQDAGDLAGSEALYRESLALRRKSLGDEHPDVAGTLNNLARNLQFQGDLDGAEPMYREALTVFRKSLGDQHPNVASCLNNLAGVLQARGDSAGAESLYRESLAIRRHAFGEEHPMVAGSLGSLGGLLVDRGDLAAAEPLLRESLAMRTKTLPKGHLDIASGQASLGLCLIRLGEYAEAERLLREALSIREAKLPAGHSQSGNARSLLGEALTAQGSFEAAEPLLLSGYEQMKDDPAVSALRKRDALLRIERLYESWGKPERAAEWRALLDARQAVK